MNMQVPTKILPFTSVFIKCSKDRWNTWRKARGRSCCSTRQNSPRFLSQLGLTLILDEQDGYAYIRHTITGEEDNTVTWIQRRSLTYEESVMLVLLREMMAEFEVSEATTRELNQKRRREIKEYAELFFKENASRVKFFKGN